MINAAIYQKLADYCALQERCAADIIDKLWKLKVDKSEMDEYVTKLKDSNFLNEERYAKAFVEAYSRKKWGRVKIKNALMRKGINAAAIKKYIDDLEDGDYDEQIKTLMLKKWGTIKAKSPRDKQVKLMRFLLGKGFEMDKIKAAMKFLD